MTLPRQGPIHHKKTKGLYFLTGLLSREHRREESATAVFLSIALECAALNSLDKLVKCGARGQL
ncbi:MAG: hypothetical protein ACYSWS_06090, partial [Planctomycetota bacterium]